MRRTTENARGSTLVVAVVLIGLASFGCAADFPHDGLFDLDGDGFGASDCDDLAPDIHPGAGERCDGDRLDEDCDGRRDDDDDDVVDPPSWHLDADGDGFGEPGGAVVQCAAPEGRVADDDDCDDMDADVHPGAPERCDGGHVDEDCDGAVDEAGADVVGTIPLWRDTDGDGWGDDAEETVGCAPSGALVAQGGDCDDADAAVHPEADEACNGLDDDCDGGADDLDPGGATGRTAWYTDSDGDGYGEPDSRRLACAAASDEIEASGDCDDHNGAIHPGAEEVCGDGLDQDCEAGAGACFVPAGAAPEDADAVVRVNQGGSLLGLNVGSGDTDGDGRAEAWFATPGVGGAIGVTGRLSGSRSVDDLGLANPGSATAEELGYGLATGADLDGDGIDDLVLGTPFTDDPATDAGAAFVLPGPIGSGTTEADAWFTWTGTADVYNVGATIGVGDFDGDGEGDLFVAAPADHEVAGRFGPIRAGEATVDSADVRAAGAFYQSIELGDVTGDGVDELVIGDWGSSRVFVYEGGTRSASPDSGDRLALIDTDYSGESCGYTVLAGVDTNGDGVGDVVAGAPALDSETGRVVGVYGPVGRTTYAEEDLDLTLDGTAAGGWFGVGLAAGGDLDDDGEPALVVSAPQADDGARTAAGAVYVFDGLRSGAHDANEATTTLTGTKVSQLLGYGVVTADLDGDGAEDLAVSGDRTDDDLVEAVYVFYGAWE